MKILVTGGAGFIGSKLVDRLVKDHDVTILDNLSNADISSINSSANFIKGDILNERDVAKAIKNCKAVFHLAAMVNARTDDAELDYKVNVIGSKNVFSAAKNIGAKIIFTSSAAIYGNAKVPVKEDVEKNPITQYGKSKLRAEKMLDKTAFITRFFNVYGPRGNGLVNILCKAIKDKTTVTINGSGIQSRDYIYVEDVVDALLLGLENTGIYNIGSGEEYKTLDIIDAVTKVSGIKPKLKFGPAQEEIQRSQADITKIEMLGWQPKVALEQGIENILRL